jgi:hypothetical protein
MLDTRLILSGTWIAVMLIYLLGDVLRIYSGDFPKTMDTAHFTQPMWLGIAVLMITPIIMLFLCLVLPQPISRWVNIIAAIFWFLFNLVGLPTYPSAYDRFLLIVSMVFNGVTVWYAWNWAA